MTLFSELFRMRQEAAEAGEPVLRQKSFELLLETVRTARPASMLEIGTNRGLTGIAMLLTSENSRLTGIEKDAERADAARENYKRFGVSDRAKIFEGDASEIIPVLTGKYDFIFLDGAKGHYHEYFPHLADALNKGGILFADNVLFRGYVGEGKKIPHRYATIKHGMEQFLRLASGENFLTRVYDIDDGVSITKKIK